MLAALTTLMSSYRPANNTEATDVDRIQQLLRSGANPWRRDSALHITASALVVHPPSNRVLLRWHPRQRAWLQVGGHADPGECDPLRVALREAEEETGLPDLTPWPDGSLLHAVIVQVAANEKEPAHEHADLRFLLRTDRPEAAKAERPDAPLRWLSLASAREANAEPNVRETLARVDRLLAN